MLTDANAGFEFIHLAVISAAHPHPFLQGFLNLLGPAEVFACENGTLFFHQDENFFLAIGEVFRLCVFSVCLLYFFV